MRTASFLFSSRHSMDRLRAASSVQPDEIRMNFSATAIAAVECWTNLWNVCNACIFNKMDSFTELELLRRRLLITK